MYLMHCSLFLQDNLKPDVPKCKGCADLMKALEETVDELEKTKRRAAGYRNLITGSV